MRLLIMSNYSIKEEQIPVEMQACEWFNRKVQFDKPGACCLVVRKRISRHQVAFREKWGMAPSLPGDQILFVGSELVLPESIHLSFFLRAEGTSSSQHRPLPMAGWGCCGLLANGDLFNTYQLNIGLKCCLGCGYDIWAIMSWRKMWTPH